VPVSEEFITKFVRDLQPMFDSVRNRFEEFSASMRRLYPVVNEMYEAHRSEVKRVHTAYRRRKRGRW